MPQEAAGSATSKRSRRIANVVGEIFLLAGVMLFALGGQKVRIVSSGMVIGFLLLLGGAFTFVFRDVHGFQRSFRSTVIVTLPVLIAGMLFFIARYPGAAFAYSGEDQLFENIQAILFFVAGLTMILVAWKTWRDSAWALRIVLLAIALVLLVVVGEEISWGQRLFGVQTAGWFQDKNMQAENNLHNLNSFAAEAVAYALTTLFFVLIPYFRTAILTWTCRASDGRGRLASALRKQGGVRLLEFLLPRRWMVLPFAAVVAFTFVDVDRGSSGEFFYFHPFYPLAITVTIVVLVRMLLESPLADVRRTLYVCFVLAVFVAAIIVTVHWQVTETIATRPSVSEFRETIIALGVSAYAIDLLLGLFGRTGSAAGPESIQTVS